MALPGFLLAVFALTILGSQSQKIGPPGDLGVEIWSQNNFLKDLHKVVKSLNLSDCWMCMHVPGHAGGGLPLHAVPFNMSGWRNYGGGNTLYDVMASVKIALMEQASICFTRTGDDYNLGKYDNCEMDLSFDNISDIIHRTQTVIENTKIHSLNDFINVIESDTMAVHGACSYMRYLKDQADHSEGKVVRLPQGLWLLCGHYAYQHMMAHWTGTCTLGYVIPVVYKVEKLPEGRLRNKRALEEAPLSLGGNLGTQIARGAFPPLGVAMNYRDLHLLNTWTVAMFNQTIISLKLINQELNEVRQVAIQNRYALDIILAAKGGVCALIHSHCCVYVHDNSLNITHTVKVMEGMIKDNPLAGTGSGTVDIWGAIWSWLPDGSWMRSILMTIIMIVVVLVALCCCIQCLPSLCTMMRSWIPKPKDAQDIQLISTEVIIDPSYQTQKEEMWE